MDFKKKYIKYKKKYLDLKKKINIMKGGATAQTLEITINPSFRKGGVFENFNKNDIIKKIMENNLTEVEDFFNKLNELKKGGKYEKLLKDIAEFFKIKIMESDDEKYKKYNKLQKKLWKQNNFENTVNDIAKDSGKTNEWKQFRKNWKSKTDEKLVKEFKEIAYNKFKLEDNLKIIKSLLFDGDEFKFNIDSSKLTTTAKPSVQPRANLLAGIKGFKFKKPKTKNKYFMIGGNQEVNEIFNNLPNIYLLNDEKSKEILTKFLNLIDQIKADNMTEDYKKLEENIKKINKVDKPDFNKKIDESKDKYPKFYKFFEQYKEKAKKVDIDVKGDTKSAKANLTGISSEDEELIKNARMSIKMGINPQAVRAGLSVMKGLPQEKIDEIMKEAEKKPEKKPESDGEKTVADISNKASSSSDELKELRRKIKELEEELEKTKDKLNESKSEYKITGDRDTVKDLEGKVIYINQQLNESKTKENHLVSIGTSTGVSTGVSTNTTGTSTDTDINDILDEVCNKENRSDNKNIINLVDALTNFTNKIVKDSTYYQ